MKKKGCRSSCWSSGIDSAWPPCVGIFTMVTQKICNYSSMNKIILGGFSRDCPERTHYSATGTSLEDKVAFRSRLR